MVLIQLIFDSNLLVADINMFLFLFTRLLVCKLVTNLQNVSCIPYLCVNNADYINKYRVQSIDAIYQIN